MSHTDVTVRYRFTPIFVFIVLLSLCSAAMAETLAPMNVTQGLSLPQALAIGAENNDKIRNQKLRVQRAIFDYEVVNGRYVPDFHLNFYFNWNSVDIESDVPDGINDTSNTQTVEFKVIFPWWHKGDERLHAAQKLLDIELQKNNLRDVEQEIALAIYQSYYNVVMQEEKLRIAQRNRAVAEARQVSVSEQLSIGRSSQRDAITENSNLINHHVNVQTNELELQDMRDTLLDYLGVSAEQIDLERVTLTARLTDEQFDLASFDIKDAVAEQLLNIELEIERQHIDIKLSGKSWSPRLSARVAYTPEVEAIGTSTSEYEDLVSYGVVFQLPFPNFAADKSGRRLANHDLNDLLLKRDQTMASTMKNAAKLKRKMAGLERKKRLLKTLVVEKQKEVNSARESFSIGKTSNLELQMVESVMMDAESSLYSTLYDYTQLQGQIRQLYGQDVLGRPTGKQGSVREQ